MLLLGRLERVTRAVEDSNYATLPYVYLHLYELYHWLGKEELFDERSSIWDFNAEVGNREWGSHEVHEAITSLRRQLRAGMQDRFVFLKHKGIPITSWPAKDQTEVKPLVIAMALHPEGPPDMSDLNHPDLIISTSPEEQAAKDRCREVLEDHARILVLDAACDQYRDRHGRPLKSAGTLVPPTGSRGLPVAGCGHGSRSFGRRAGHICGRRHMALCTRGDVECAQLEASVCRTWWSGIGGPCLCGWRPWRWRRGHVR